MRVLKWCSERCSEAHPALKQSGRCFQSDMFPHDCQQGVRDSSSGMRAEDACMRLQASKGTRIRQGGPNEDKALAAHVLELLPSRQLLTEAAQLCEILILLGHESDAGILQQVGKVRLSAHGTK